MYFLKALDLEPNNYEWHKNLAIFYDVEKGDNKLAKKHYLLSLDLKPTDITCINNYAKLLLEDGHTDKAIKLFETVIEIDPAYSHSVRNLIEIFLDRNMFTEASDLICSYAEHVQNFGEVVFGYLNSISSEKKIREFSTELLKALERVNIRDAYFHFVLGEFFEDKLSDLGLANEQFIAGIHTNKADSDMFIDYSIFINENWKSLSDSSKSKSLISVPGRFMETKSDLIDYYLSKAMIVNPGNERVHIVRTII